MLLSIEEGSDETERYEPLGDKVSSLSSCRSSICVGLFLLRGACSTAAGSLRRGFKIMEAPARTARTSAGTHSPVGTRSSAELNVTRYSGARAFSSGLNARTTVRPTVVQKPRGSRTFPEELMVTRN